MGDAKNMLPFSFNSGVDASCKYWDKELEIKELKDKISDLLKQSAAHSHARDRQQNMKEQHTSRLLTSALKEGEKSDMDIDINDDDASDEDWSEIGERRPPRSRARKVKAHKNLNGHTEKPLDTTQSDVDPKKQQPCCSCGRSSGCVTMKCACKAAGSWCSSNHGCSLRKCANRDGETLEVLEALETLKKDVQRAERVLLKHGAAVLENVWTDEQQATGLVARIRSSGHLGACKPLSDIGNQAQAEDIDGQQKLKLRKRWGKILVQLVPTTTAAQAVSETAIAGQRQPQVACLHDPPFAESLMEEGTKKGLQQMNRPSLTIDHVVSYVLSVGEVKGLQQLYGVTLPRDGFVFTFLGQKNCSKLCSEIGDVL